MSQWNDVAEAHRKLQAMNPPHWENYLGFYSSWLDGYFREPWAMLMPLDDHGFHRGDGVFEAARIYNGAYFDLPSHLKRLKRSAEAIGMDLPKTIDEIQAICVKLANLCGAREGALRLFITRGPGSFSPSPKDVVGHQLYAAITKMKPPSDASYANGVSAMFSTVPAKSPFWSQIKSCNYLQNVLMKQETHARGVDFAICLDEGGILCEGSTENFMLVTRDNRMIVPKFDYTLRGTTMIVVMKLAEKLVNMGMIKSVEFGDLHRDDLKHAAEAAFVGTTLGVLPITTVEGHRLGDVGPICKALHAALMKAMADEAAYRTEFAK
jgi:branched-chain amino acid aminotransferase